MPATCGRDASRTLPCPAWQTSLGAALLQGLPELGSWPFGSRSEVAVATHQLAAIGQAAGERRAVAQELPLNLEISDSGIDAVVSLGGETGRLWPRTCSTPTSCRLLTRLQVAEQGAHRCPSPRHAWRRSSPDAARPPTSQLRQSLQKSCTQFAAASVTTSGGRQRWPAQHHLPRSNAKHPLSSWVPGGLSAVVAGPGACLMASPPQRPGQPVGVIFSGRGDQGGEQVADLVAGQFDQLG